MVNKREETDVFKVYNRIAEWFSKNRYALNEEKYLDQMISRLKADASVLDLGCGSGKPVLQYLLEKGLNVMGVDASSAILEIAKKNFPATDFVLMDMRTLKLNRKFDAIIAWHSFFHLPATDQRRMFEIFAQHLNPGGYLLFTSGIERGEVWGENGGEYLFHASLDVGEYSALLRQHQFQIEQQIVNDLDCGGANVWMAQYKPS